MKKYIISALILLIFTGFALFVTAKRNITVVVGIINPATLRIDFNHNKMSEPNETICIADIEIPTLDLNSANPKFLKDYSKEDGIKLGYLAQEFAKNTLYMKNVKVKFTGEFNQNCRYAEVYIDNKAYSDILTENGYASKSGKYNVDKIKENLANKTELVIYNIKSNKYHKLNCEYGKISSDHSIRKKSDLPKSAMPCKFCHVTPTPIGTKAVTVPQMQVDDGDIKLYITDFTTKLKPDRDCTNQACQAIVKEINNTKESVDIACYTWEHIPAIMQALKAAHGRGVKIRVVYDTAIDPANDYTVPTSELLSLSDENNTDLRLNQIAFTSRLMHNKFMIFDSKVVTTGSMNYTITGLSGFNGNSILVIKSKEIADLYKAEFEQMLSGKFHEEKSPLNIQNKFIIGDNKIRIYFSPYDKTSQYIIPLINNAKQYIYIPAFVVTHDKIANAIINAKKRGIDVKIIIDANNYSSMHSKCPELRKNKIPVKTENYAGKIHSKTMIIDDTYLIIGSMNFSASGERWNDENLIILESPKFAKTYKKFFEYLWSRIDDKWLKLNAHSESIDSIGSCSDGIDNDYDEKIDMEDSGCSGTEN